MCGVTQSVAITPQATLTYSTHAIHKFSFDATLVYYIYQFIDLASSVRFFMESVT